MKKRMLSILMLVFFCLTLAIPVAAKSAPDRVVDEAGLLSKSEESALRETLDEMSEEYQADIVVVTLESVGRESIDDYIVSYFEDNDYGLGDDKSCAMLMIDMEERDIRILTYGFCNDAMSDSDVDNIIDEISPMLTDEEYADAFHTFADKCAEYIDGYLNFPVFTNLIICLVIGLVIALIATGVMRGQLKTVRKQDTANQYVKSGSMHVTHSSDLFLYRNVSRVKKAQNSSGSHGGGSGARVRGGKF